MSGEKEKAFYEKPLYEYTDEDRKRVNTLSESDLRKVAAWHFHQFFGSKKCCFFENRLKEIKS